MMSPILYALKKSAWFIIAASTFTCIAIWLSLPSLQSMENRLHDFIPTLKNTEIRHYERAINGDYAIFLAISDKDFEEIRLTSTHFKTWNKLTREHNFQIGYHELSDYDGLFSATDSRDGRVYCLLWDKHSSLLVFTLCSSVF